MQADQQSEAQNTEAARGDVACTAGGGIPQFKAFLKRTKLLEKPFQSECFQWCWSKEQLTNPSIGVEGSGHIYPSTGLTLPSTGGSGGACPPGGILALEMGLGKTIIMLALIECHFKYHTLIVVPLSLLNQWEKNIQLYFGHQPLVYHGSQPKNLLLSLEEITARPIVLTTYGQIALPSLKQLNKGKKLSLLHKIMWDRLICDEGHHVSHKKTNEYKGVQALTKQICWLVTGTPIQNSEKELFNLFALLGLPKTNTYKDDDVYKKTVKDYVYHKTKASAHIILPALHEHFITVECETESELQFSRHIHSLLSFCNVPMQFMAKAITLAEDPKALRMKYMSRARQVCIHPPILKETIKHVERMLSIKKQDKQSKSEEKATVIDIAELYVSESKINALLKTLLERKDNGCGKIVFCHYYAEIDIIEKRLKEKATQCEKQIKIGKFDGRVPSSQRHTLLSEPFDVLLAQIKMCREGLNMQDNYSEVYFPSPDFNPAMEDQAIARCWRIGQTKPVHVFKYMMGGSPPAKQAPHPASKASPTIFNASLLPDHPCYRRGACFAGGAGAFGTPSYSLDSYSLLLQGKKRKLINKMEDAAL
jgi:SNF2 family DNA or RNA helicase